MKISVKKVEDDAFLCPFCEKEITELLSKVVVINGNQLIGLRSRPIYACPHCNRIIPGPVY